MPRRSSFAIAAQTGIESVPPTLFLDSRLRGNGGLGWAKCSELMRHSPFCSSKTWRHPDKFELRRKLKPQRVSLNVNRVGTRSDAHPTSALPLPHEERHETQV